VIIAVAAALATAFSPLGIVSILALAGGIGIILYHSRTKGVVVLGVLLAVTATLYLVPWSGLALVSEVGNTRSSAQAPGILDIGWFFLKVGALSFGGGLTLIAFIQEQVVNQYQWLTHREFIDGLALGQFTPGPILMVSAYVGYKLAGIAGAAVAATAIFLPAFVLMLSILPVFERARKILWTKAAIKGIGPAVIGVLAVSLLQMAPHALPDPIAGGLFVGTVAAMLAWKVGAIRLLALGAVVGVVRERLLSLPGIRGAL
jgi:chromate transporter